MENRFKETDPSRIRKKLRDYSLRVEKERQNQDFNVSKIGRTLWIERTTNRPPKTQTRTLSASEQNRRPQMQGKKQLLRSANTKTGNLREEESIHLDKWKRWDEMSSDSLVSEDERFAIDFNYRALDYIQPVKRSQTDSLHLPTIQKPSYPNRPQRRIRFADQEDAIAVSNSSLLNANFGKELQNAFAKHALNQKDASPPKSRLKLTLRHRVLLLGHRAGLWLRSFTYESFYDSAKVLVLHQYQTFKVRGTHDVGGKLSPADIYIDVKTGDRIETHHLGSNVTANRKKFLAKILPLLEQKNPKHVIRVRGVDLECGFDCDCGDSTEIQVEAPDYGFLDMKADWHLWREKLIINSIIFEETVLDTLFPSPPYDEANHFTLDVSDQSFNVTRGLHPSLPPEVQQALSAVTTSEAIAGSKPSKVRLWWHKTPELRSKQGRNFKSSEQISPSLVRAAGNYFVHRLARPTCFTYEAPWTMERILIGIRNHLYPDTPVEEKLKIRLIPSAEFMSQGRLLVPISEHRNYRSVISRETGQTIEDCWSTDILGKFMNPLEDIYAIKIFSSIKVTDGTGDGENYRSWDTTDFGKVTNRNFDTEIYWSTPPQSFMHSLAEISKDLLNIDPRISDRGILIRVDRELPFGSDIEWLPWHAPQTFNGFLQEVFYKIDSNAVKIYPGDYEESVSTTTREIAKTIMNMQQKHAKDKTFETRSLSRKASLSNSEGGRSEMIYQIPHVMPGSFPLDPRLAPVGQPIQPEVFTQASVTNLSPRILTQAQIESLRLRLVRAENELLLRELSCRICGVSFGDQFNSAQMIHDHYQSHTMPETCPMCPQLWTNLDHQDKIEHLLYTHSFNSHNIRGGCPQRGCTEELDNVRIYPSYYDVYIHILGHNRMNACKTNQCHCPFGSLLPWQKREHLVMHPQEDTSEQSPQDRPIRPFPSLTPRTRERLELPLEDSNEDLNTRPPKKKGKRYHCPLDYENLEPGDVDEEAAIIIQINHMKRSDHDGYKLKDLLVITTAQGKAERDRREKEMNLRRKAAPRPLQANTKEVQKEVNRFRLSVDRKSKLEDPNGGGNRATTGAEPVVNTTRSEIAATSLPSSGRVTRKPKSKDVPEIGNQGQAEAVSQAPSKDTSSQAQAHSPEESGRGKRKRKQTDKAGTAPSTPSNSKRSRKRE